MVEGGGLDLNMYSKYQKQRLVTSSGSKMSMEGQTPLHYALDRKRFS